MHARARLELSAALAVMLLPSFVSKGNGGAPAAAPIR